MKNKSLKIICFSIIICILIIVLLVAIDTKKHKVANDNYESINNLFLESESEKEDINNKVVKTVKKFSFDYEKMLSLNKEAKGYIILENSNISYPIMQHTDNQYYLTHDSTNNYSVNGAIFIDSNCDEGLNGQVCIIYGHHMNNGSMFADLSKFNDAQYARKHSSFVIYNGQDKFLYEVISSYITNPDDTNTYITGFSNDEELQEWEQKIIDKSKIKYNIDSPSENDKLIILSTCTNKGDTRNIVIIRKKEEYD
jgi:sortase B